MPIDADNVSIMLLSLWWDEGTLFELRSREAKFNGSLFEVHAMGEDCSIFKAVSDGLTTFEVTSGGMLKTHGLRLESGGVHVASGGMQVDAGGLSVRGGLTIEAGEMVLEQAQLRVGQIIAAADAAEMQRALFSGRIESPFYTGAAVELTAAASRESKSSNSSEFGLVEGQFSFVKFRRSSGDASKRSSAADTAVFEVDGDGHIHSAAGADFSGNVGVSVRGPLRIRGDMTVERVTLLPSPLKGKEKAEGASKAKATHEITIPASATYVVISPVVNSAEAACVRINLEPEVSTAAQAGRVMIMSNLGQRTTEGALRVPAQSTVMFLHDGKEWISIEALKAPIQVMSCMR